MNIQLGRIEQLPMTNKSGVALSLGDVVVVDLTTTQSITTTTTSGFVGGRVGVVIEPNGIASNAMGMICFSGYVSQINLSGSASIGDLIKTHTVAKQGVRHAAPAVAGDFAQAIGTGATPPALLFGTPVFSPTVSVQRSGSTTDTHLAIWNGTNADSIKDGGALSGIGALNLLEQHTASSSASLDFTTAISSTYDDYIIRFVGIVPASNNVSFQMKVSTNGGSTYVGGTSYNYGMLYSGISDVPQQTSGSGVAAIDLAHAVSTTANYSINGSISLFSPGGAGYKFIEGKVQAMAGGNLYQWGNSGVYLAATAVNAFQFIFSSGNISSGTIRVYGVAK